MPVNLKTDKNLKSLLYAFSLLGGRVHSKIRELTIHVQKAIRYFLLLDTE